MNIIEIANKMGFNESQFSALQSSIYPGANIDSILLVLHYCKAANLDPMMKPVHIVPMSVKSGGKYEMRDVVMPGIGLYRIQAERSGRYAGMSEPLYGSSITTKLGFIEITYPEWCQVTVQKIISIPEQFKQDKESYFIADFKAREFWIENYASKKDSQEPNAMWRRRVYGQITKCAEAQALRKAFPELGSQPTAEEMAGKTLDGEYDLVEATKNVITLDERLLTGEPLIPESEAKPAQIANHTDIQKIIDDAKVPQDLNAALNLTKDLPEDAKRDYRQKISVKRQELVGG